MRRRVRQAALVAAVITGVGLTAVMCQRVSERGRYASAFSTYGAGPEGTRGLYLLASREGAAPRRWAEELGRLPEGGMLVALGDCDQWMRRPLGRVERETLTRWVEAGGVLLVAGAPGYLDDAGLGVRLSGRCGSEGGLIGMLARAEDRRQQRKRTGDDAELAELGDAFTEEPGAAFEDLTEDELPPPRFVYPLDEAERLPSVAMRSPLTVEVDEDRPRQTLLRIDGPDGPVAGVRVDVGEGAVVVLASASLFQNRDLAEHRGGVLFARLLQELAPGGPVLFDEYHLGVGERRSMMRYLRQAGLAPLGLQLLLLIALLIWRFGARFGSPQQAPPPEPAGTASYVEGVGTLYAKAADPQGTLAIVARRALERVAEHHRLAERAAEAIAERLEERGRAEEAEAVRGIARRVEEGSSARGLSKALAAIDRLSAAAMK